MSDPGHGNSPAAWTGVTIMLVAAVILAVGVFFGWSWTYWVGGVMALVGAASWYGLAAAGYGEQEQVEGH